MSFVKPEQRDDAVGYEDDSLSPSDDEARVRDEDEDVYEDSGDLDMADAGTKVWLVRMPKYLRDRWLETDSQDDLGIVRLRQDQPNDIRLILSESSATEGLPREYKLAVTNTNVTNTYVFAEENVKAKKDEGASNGGERANGHGKYEGRQRRYQPYGRANVPKRTAIAGTVFHECLLTVSASDKNYDAFIAQRQRLNDATPRPQVELLTEKSGVMSAIAGPSMRDSSSTFLRAPKPDKEKAQKAARIPKNELLDLLFRLFEMYDYWGMKGLRERTRQPEAYLKEVLEPIAILNKKGPYNSKYCLKPEYKGRTGAV